MKFLSLSGNGAKSFPPHFVELELDPTLLDSDASMERNFFKKVEMTKCRKRKTPNVKIIKDRISKLQLQ